MRQSFQNPSSKWRTSWPMLLKNLPPSKMKSSRTFTNNSNRLWPMKTMNSLPNSETKSLSGRKNDSSMKKSLGFLFFFFLLPFIALAQDTNLTIQPNEGVSMHSIMRGVLGMIVLIALAYAFSSNRKAIRWKTVGIGLTFQLLIAIGVLKVTFIQRAFEAVGRIFVSILDFTRAGSKFLFEGLVADMNT